MSTHVTVKIPLSREAEAIIMANRQWLRPQRIQYAKMNIRLALRADDKVKLELWREVLNANGSLHEVNHA